MGLVAALLVALGVVVWSSPSATARRLARLGPLAIPASPRPEPDRTLPWPGSGPEWITTRPRRDPRRTVLLSVACAVAAAFAVGGWMGVGFGAVAGGVVGVLAHRSRPRAERIRRERLVADVPLAAELMAVTLRAGRPPERSVEVVADALPGALGDELALVAASLRLGAPAESAWERLLAEPDLAAFARAMVRSWDSGAPLSDLLERLARDYRRTVRARAVQRARSVGVKAAAPLGLCFLPAFVLVGIVPLVAGAVGRLLSG